MERELDGAQQRRIRIQTVNGLIEGVLTTSPGVSTMHYLNVVSASQNFLHVQPPVACTEEWAFGDEPLAVATDSILFVSEVLAHVPTPGDPHAAAQFKRALVRLRLADYSVEGYVHVPPGGDAIARLNQDRHAFIALTSVKVSGPDTELESPFLAASRPAILAVQAVAQEEPAEEPVPIGAEFEV